jgi:hypothetical protein
MNERTDSNGTTDIFSAEGVRKRVKDSVTYEEQEMFQDLGLSQERRRAALRKKDYDIKREDVFNTKVATLK